MTSPLRRFDIADLVPADRRALFEDCVIEAADSALANIEIVTPGVPGPRRGHRIVVTPPQIRGRVRIALGPGQASIRIDTAGPLNLDIRTWRTSSLQIGEGTTINQARIICDEADITIGRDGLWSDEVLVQSNDQHGIIDLESGAVINAHRRKIDVGDHVWIGRRAIVMPDTSVGSGSILAAGALLTGDVPPRTIFAGTPARLLRENVSWSRSPEGFSARESREFGATLFGPGGLGPSG